MAGVIALLLAFAASSPRARLNIMQVIWALFLIGLLIRARSFLSVADPNHENIHWPYWASLAAAFFAWTTGLNSYFISDDYALLYWARGPALNQLWSLLRYGQGGTFLRPLGLASLFLDYRFYGESPLGYHLTNVLLHILAAGGVFALCRGLDIEPETSAFAAGIFAAMPIQVEAVQWMGARFDMLATPFTIWAAAFWLWSNKRSSHTAFGASVVLYIFATISKESGFVLPLLLAAIELIVFRTVPKLKVAAIAALGAAIFGYRLFVLRGIGGYVRDGSVATWDIGPKTLEGLLIRSPAQIFTGINWTSPPLSSAILIAAIIGSVMLFLVVYARVGRREWQIIQFALAWILLTILPAHFLSLVGAGLTNSRILYMGSAGAAIILGILFGGVKNRTARYGLYAVLTLALAAGVVHNVAAWRYVGDLSRGTLLRAKQIEPSPRPRTHFVFSDMPDSIRGVFLFHVAITEGMRLVYNRNDITAGRDTEPAASDSSSQIRIEWEENPEKIVRREGQD